MNDCVEVTLRILAWVKALDSRTYHLSKSANVDRPLAACALERGSQSFKGKGQAAMCWRILFFSLIDSFLPAILETDE